MDHQFSFHSLSDDGSENRALQSQTGSNRRGQFAVPINNFASTINTPAGQLQPFTQPNASFTPQLQLSQTPMVPNSIPVYDSTWGTPTPSQTHFPPVYHQYTIPSTSPPHLGNQWALNEYNTTSQMISEVRACLCVLRWELTSFSSLQLRTLDSRQLFLSNAQISHFQASR